MQGGEVPRVDPLPVGIGLVAHRVEPGAVEKRQAQRMRGEHLVEPDDGAGGARQGGCKRRIDGSRAQRVQHCFHPVALSFERVVLTFGDAARPTGIANR